MMRQSSKFISILKFTYLQGIKAKWFLISTLSVILFIVIGLNFANIKDLFKTSSNNTHKVAVINNTESMTSNELLDIFNGLQNGWKYCEILESNVVKENIKEQSSEYEALIVFNKLGTPSTVYYGSKISDVNLSNNVIGVTDNIVRTLYAKECGLNSDQIDTLLLKKMVEKVSYSNNKGNLLVASAVFMLILYMMILIYGSSIANSIIEEKSNKIVETLLCYAKPFSLVAGKICGFLCLAISQIILWAITVFASIKIFSVPDLMAHYLSTKTLIIFAINILLGFLIYSFLFAALASFAENSQDSTQLMMPVILLLIAAFYSSMYLGTTSLSLLTYVPFFAPMTFISLSLGQNNISVAQIVLNIFVQVLEIIIVGFFCSRLYHKGVLGGKLFKGEKRK